MLATVGLGGAAYAYNSLYVTTTLSLKEPLSINATSASGDLALDSVSCTISTDSSSATCGGSVFAGDFGAIAITVANSGHEALTVTPAVTSTSTDVMVTLPSVASVPAGGIYVFTFNISVSADAATPDPVILTMTFAR